MDDSLLPIFLLGDIIILMKIYIFILHRLIELLIASIFHLARVLKSERVRERVVRIFWTIIPIFRFAFGC